MRHLIDIAFDWGLRCFGASHMNDVRVRSIRAVEEVIELAQALDVPKETILLLVETVYSRPAGNPYQEVGGSMVTLTVLCRALRIDPEEAFAIEIRRVLSKDPAHFAARNQTKLDSGLRS